MLTSPRPNYPCLNIPHAQSIFLSSPLTARAWFSPQATLVKDIPLKQITFVGTVTSEV
jgi:hypothetical protein